MVTNEKPLAKNPKGNLSILLSLALVSLLVVFWLWRLAMRIPDLAFQERTMAVGAASFWLGYKMLNLLWVLVVSMFMALWQSLISGMVFIKRALAIVFFCLGQIIMLYSVFFPIIVIVSLFYFVAAWFMNNLILETRYDFK